MPNSRPVVTRFAPSPTGLLHAGNYRTAVFSYLFARKHQGKFILRIEDTDKERSKPEYEANILESLDWLGLDYDEMYRQSEKAGRHREYLERLIAEDKAYISQEAQLKAGDRESVIRLRNSGQSITFTDLIRGDITTDTTDLGDFVIAKSLDEPIFHLAVVIDDFESGVTHVVRGEDHISNTPRHILIQQAIGAPTPDYAHLPLVLAPDKSKLSKRNGAVAMTEYRKEGYLPEAIFNFLTLLGWSPQSASSGTATNEEIFTKDQLVDLFDLKAVQKSGAVFNTEKLKWFNKEHLKLRPVAEVGEAIKKYLPVGRLTDNQIAIVSKILLDRISTIHEVAHIWASGEFNFLIESPQPSKELLKTTEHLPGLTELLETISEDNFTAENIKTTVWDFATEKGRGNVLWPMRVALTGQEKSPDPFTVAELLGKTETISRLTYASQQ